MYFLGKGKRKGQKRSKSPPPAKPAGSKTVGRKTSTASDGTLAAKKSVDGGRKTPASEGKTDVTDSEQELNVADYIPVHKQAVIGKNYL